MINQENRIHYLYILYDPTFISKKFYVGYSYRPNIRLKEHIEGKKENPFKENWIKKMARRNVEPVPFIITSAPTKTLAGLIEIQLIAFFRDIGVKLTNILDGGNIPPYKAGENHSMAKLNKKQVEEIRDLFFNKKVSKAQLSIQFNVSITNIKDIIAFKIWKNDFTQPENLRELINKRNKEDLLEFHKNRNGENHPSFGKKATEETRRKLSISHKGQVSHNKGKKTSAETRLKNSLSHMGQPGWNKGLKMSDEYKEKCRKRQTGKKYNQETKDKHSILSSGENNGSSKLKADDVIKIRELYSFGNHTYKMLSKQYNIDKSTIAQIIKRKTWKHI